tara:strand:- start:183 stop:923 length:741 start_codon:yes stop_codon:yes gene_type:complete
MKNNIYHFLSNIKYKTGALALIDPDSKNNDRIVEMVDKIEFSNFDAILVGGSRLSDNQCHDRIKKIKSLTSKPVILFPGSSDQLNKHVDAILYLSLISGRDSRYLIDEHVKSALKIYDLNIETIPVGYILIDGGRVSAVQEVTSTQPLEVDDDKSILSHALAGQYLGYKFIFLESGSGANEPINSNTVKILKEYIQIPLIVGGGIVTISDIENLKENAPDFIVIGNFLECEDNKNQLKDMVELIHD